ncbi:alpha/beta hydrolase family protein [Cecembia rubra]|uniref:alpha/beta hydrolase family protein n=1 Tax=Cecembia rubra TaxID=1485585 RepID=UPI002715227C|nr:alpha/beta hydrolase family protein [Cecembia rubra]
MGTKRRDFIKQATWAGMGMFAVDLNGIFVPLGTNKTLYLMNNDFEKNQLGKYGPWAKSLFLNKMPSLSFRKEEFSDLSAWKVKATAQVKERMGYLGIEEKPKITVHRVHLFDGLICEEISYQLPYGNPTRAVILKPENVTGKLPAVLGLHCHGGNKYLGLEKICKVSYKLPEYVEEHQQQYYEGSAWANELAKQGYVVMVHDAFSFGSRRVLLEDVPEERRRGIKDFDMGKVENINAYNSWASDHEHIMAKSLFSAGLSWPAVYLAEDQIALDILASRNDVDPFRLGCAGLSGGGLRAVMLGGLDDRIACAISVGFMTTWADLLMNKSHNHTWMIYIPLLPRELDFPEIFALRAPKATMVLNDIEDTLFTLEEMKKADEMLAEIFSKAGASEKYRCTFHPGPHKFDKNMQAEAFEWFDRWLK